MQKCFRLQFICGHPTNLLGIIVFFLGFDACALQYSLGIIIYVAFIRGRLYTTGISRTYFQLSRFLQRRGLCGEEIRSYILWEELAHPTALIILVMPMLCCRKAVTLAQRGGTKQKLPSDTGSRSAVVHGKPTSTPEPPAAHRTLDSSCLLVLQALICESLYIYMY